MGRKIPAKKHRGVKDPLVQQARRLQELKTKINAPPKDPDEQPVPRSLTRLFAFQDRNKSKDSKNKIKRYNRKDCENLSSYHDNPIAKLQKLPGESGRGFSLRINSAVKALHNPALLEDYPQDIDAEDVKGEQMALQRARRKKKQKKMVATDNNEETTPKLSRSQKLALKRKAKRDKALEEREGAGEVQYERVEFGEVAHAPPSLHVKPRRSKNEQGAPRPGRRDLLLSALLSGKNTENSKNSKIMETVTRKGKTKKSKKEKLPAVELERRERARLDAVAAYRALRKQKTPLLTHTHVNLLT